MKCIVCNQEVLKKSKEHIFPESLGGKLKVHCVCKDCNSKLGSSIEASFLNDSTILFLRCKYKISAKSCGEPPIILDLDFYDDNTKEKIICFRDKKKQSNIVNISTPYYLKERKNPEFKTISSILSYNKTIYFLFSIKVIHEFLYYLYADNYEKTVIYSVFSDLLYEYISKNEITLNLESDVRFFSFKDLQKKLTFEIKREAHDYALIVNVFNYFIFTFEFNDDSGIYNFIENYKYEEKL
ncbi:MAG: HNH endonuclease [Anaeroplasmataceae bacterium]|nr:HNH endonuclease [Anaeroplasmataceae bacterium]